MAWRPLAGSPLPILTYCNYDDSNCNDVPEFSVIAAGVAMIGAIAGIVAFRRH